MTYSNAEFPHLQAYLPAYEIVYLLEIAFLRLCLHSEIAYFTSDYSDCLGRDVVPVDGIEVKEEKKNDNTLFNVEVVKEPIPSELESFEK